MITFVADFVTIVVFCFCYYAMLSDILNERYILALTDMLVFPFGFVRAIYLLIKD